MSAMNIFLLWNKLPKLYERWGDA